MDYHITDEYSAKKNVEHNLSRIKLVSNVTTISLLMFFSMELGYRLFTKESLTQLNVMPYAVIIGVNVCWHLLWKATSIKSSQVSIKSVENIVNLYIYAMLLAGAAVTLSNSVIFNNLMLYTLILLICSAYFVLKKAQLVKPMLLSLTIIIVGYYFNVPFEQFMIKVLYLSVLSPIAYFVSRSYFTTFEKSTRTQIKLIREMEERKKIMRKLRDANRQLELRASLDPLTQLYNRHAVNEYTTQLANQAQRNPFLLSTIMLDIDFFKQYNDTYGHLAGDEALMAVGRVLQKVADEHQVFAARWGGEEFMLLLLNAKEYKLKAVCEMILIEIKALQMEHSGSKVSNYLTVSIGAHSVLVKESQQVLESLNYADTTLYDVKNNGRNGYAICMAVV